MATEPVEFEIKVNDGGATSRIDNVTKSFKGLDQGSQELSRTSENTNRRLQGLNNIAGDLGQGFARLHPELQQAVQGLQSIATSAIQGGAAFGPWGIAIGAATSALPMLVTALSETESQVGSTATAIQRMTSDLEDAIRVLREFDAASSLDQRRQMGLLSADEARGEQLQAFTVDMAQMGGILNRVQEEAGVAAADAVLNAALNNNREEVFRALSASIDDPETLGELNQMIDRAITANRNFQAAAERAEQTIAEEDAAATEEVEGQAAIDADEANDRRRGGGGRNRAEREKAEAMREQARLEREERERLVEIKRIELELDQKRLDAAREIAELAFEEKMKREEERQDAIDEAADAIDRFGTSWDNAAESEEAAAEAAAEHLELLEKQDRARQAMIGLAEQGAEVIAEAFDLAEGPKAAISAALEVARAVSSFASYDYVAGAGHLLSATLFGVQAAKMGFSADTGAGIARPTAPTNNAAPSGPTGGVVINYNAPTAEALIGRQQRRADRAATRQLARG